MKCKHAGFELGVFTSTELESKRQILLPLILILKREVITYLHCRHVGVQNKRKFVRIDRFHSRGQQLCKFIGTKESFYIRKEFKSHRIGLVHQNGRRFIVLVHQYGRREVM